MAKIPVQVAESELTLLLQRVGLERFKRSGKVSEIWNLPGYPDKLLILTTDRKSIFDFVLNCLAPRTGEVITAMTVLFYTRVLKNFETHLVAWGAGIDRYLPEELRNNTELQKRALVVDKYEVEQIELIWRFNLTGSGLKNYKKTGTVYGHPVPLNLKDGDELPEPLFTPTTKEDDEHDKPISPEDVAREHGKEYEQVSGEIAKQAHEYCLDRRIIMADLKQELSKKPRIVLLDKMGGDEARFWDEDEWKQALKENRTPESYDKQILRNWGKGVPTPFQDEDEAPIIGLDNLDPNDGNHVIFVHNVVVPSEVIKETIERYFEIFRRLNDGKSLEDFQRDVMGIAA